MEVIRLDSRKYSAQCLKGPQWCSIGEACFVSECTLVLSVRGIVVKVRVDAVVNMAMTQLPFQDYKG